MEEAETSRNREAVIFQHSFLPKEVIGRKTRKEKGRDGSIIQIKREQSSAAAKIIPK